MQNEIFIAKIHSGLNLRFKFSKPFPYQYNIFTNIILTLCTTLIVIVAHISASPHLGAHFVHTWRVSTSVETLPGWSDRHTVTSISQWRMNV